MGDVAARTARHKFIRFRELRDMDELYGLDADPYKMTNLVAKPEAAEMRQQMRAELQRLLAETK